MDNRIALESGYCLKSPDMREYRICSEIGRGGSCIVYEGCYADARIGRFAGQTEENKRDFSAQIPAMSDSREELFHMVRIKECYPISVPICREKDGALRAERESLFCEEKQKLLQAYMENVRIRTVSGLINSTAEASYCFQCNNTEYIVTEYHEGTTYDRIEETDLSELLTTALAAAKVIRSYHRQNLLYLDLKSCNVLILPESREHLVLFDFDSVRRLQELKEGAELAFSDAYASPELKQGKLNKLGFSADVYSLGVMIFEKLFGRFPKLPETSLDCAYPFSESAFIDFDRYSAAVSERLSFFFHKTIAASASARWNSMDCVICALEEMLTMISGSLLFKKLMLECSNQSICFDRELIKNTLENVRCERLSEYEQVMNQKVKKAILDLLRKDGPVVQKYKEAYLNVFEHLEQVLCVQIKAEEARTKAARLLAEYRKRLSDSVERLSDFEEMKQLCVNVQSELPQEVKVVNLNRKETLWTKLFGNMETWFAMPLPQQARLEKQIDVILQQNEEQVKRAYLLLLNELFEKLAGVMPDTPPDIRSDMRSDARPGALPEEIGDMNGDFDEKPLYRRAMYMLYHQNASRREEGLRLLFDDYEMRQAEETVKELNRQLPVFDGEILAYVNAQILFLRKKSDSNTGGELMFGCKTLDGSEHIVFRLRTAYAVNNLSYKVLKTHGMVLFLLEDDEKLSLYVYTPEEEAVSLLDARRIPPIYGELIIKRKEENTQGSEAVVVQYGKHSDIDGKNLIFECKLYAS